MISIGKIDVVRCLEHPEAFHNIFMIKNFEEFGLMGKRIPSLSKP
jgi:hypothetical protein